MITKIHKFFEKYVCDCLYVCTFGKVINDYEKSKVI